MRYLKSKTAGDGWREIDFSLEPPFILARIDDLVRTRGFQLLVISTDKTVAVSLEKCISWDVTYVIMDLVSRELLHGPSIERVSSDERAFEECRDAIDVEKVFERVRGNRAPELLKVIGVISV